MASEVFQHADEVKQLVECKKTIHDAGKTKVSMYFTVEAIKCNKPLESE